MNDLTELFDQAMLQTGMTHWRGADLDDEEDLNNAANVLAGWVWAKLDTRGDQTQHELRLVKRRASQYLDRKRSELPCLSPPGMRDAVTGRGDFTERDGSDRS